MKRIIFTIVFAIAVNAIFAQTYNMKIKQGTGATYSVTSTVDEITFINTTTTPFVCGDVILYGGETYPTILIGSQCWFQKNLNIGTRIEGISNQTHNSIIEKYCYGDIDANCTTYGGLYQWAETVQYLNGATNTTSPDPAFTGNVQGICPPGWHIPTEAEFQTLKNAVDDGNDLKAIGQGTGDGEGTNESGFSALLAGRRLITTGGNFNDFGWVTYFWSSTEHNTTYALGLTLNKLSWGFNPGNFPKYYGYSVRCLKD